MNASIRNNAIGHRPNAQQSPTKLSIHVPQSEDMDIHGRGV